MSARLPPVVKLSRLLKRAGYTVTSRIGDPDLAYTLRKRKRKRKVVA
jgi:hypothetical protein